MQKDIPIICRRALLALKHQPAEWYANCQSCRCFASAWKGIGKIKE
jgi:hypothetical protein